MGQTNRHHVDTGHLWRCKCIIRLLPSISPCSLVLRFLTGFGLGGELPAASTLVSEYSPTRIRGRNVIFLESFWAWGWIAAALVAYLIIPVYGWRMAFLDWGITGILRGYSAESRA